MQYLHLHELQQLTLTNWNVVIFNFCCDKSSNVVNIHMCFILLSIQIDIDKSEVFFIKFTVFVHIHMIYVYLKIFFMYILVKINSLL